MTIKTKLYTLSLLLLAACAIQKVPEGGPIDNLPPVVLKEKPGNYSINSKERKIEIVFDEYITLKEPRKEIVIAPYMKNQPEFNVRNYKIEISFKDSLAANTTYSINFGNAIADLNEGNVLRNYTYVFSTGNHLDSAIVKGYIYNEFTGSRVKNVKVLLLPLNCDTCLYKGRPVYYTYTDSGGNFTINNIRTDTFLVYALADANNNFRYDEKELVGFLNERIITSDNVNSCSFPLFYEVPERLKMNDTKINGSKLMLCFNKTAGNLTISQDTGGILIPLKIMGNRANDTFYAWFFPATTDSLKFVARYGTAKDTMAFIKLKNKEVKQKNIPERLKINIINDLYRTGVVLINFSEPLSLQDNIPVLIYEDTIKKYSKLDLVFLDSSYTRAKLTYPFSEGINYSFVVPEKYFNSIYGSYNDTTILKLQTKKQAELGSISIIVKIPESTASYIVELVNRKDEVIRTKIIDKTQLINFLNLVPDLYVIRIIQDSNANGVWDSGNLKDQKYPEKVLYYKEQILLKPNWELNDIIFQWPVK